MSAKSLEMRQTSCVRRGGDGGEFGATTGSPRRMGWLDLVASRYGCQVQGATSRLRLRYWMFWAIWMRFRFALLTSWTVSGLTISHVPAKLKRCKPILTKLPGWKCDIRGIKKYEDLPENCRNYIEFVEKEIGVPIKIVSNGPSREDIIYR